MHRVVPRGRRGPFAAFAALASSFTLGNAVGGAPAKVYVFGAKPNTAFEVRQNNAPLTTTTSTLLGSLHVDADATAGDRFELRGPDVQPPVPPLFSSLTSDAPGCATAAWLPSGDPTVVGYVLSFGTLSVEGGDASSYAQSVEVGASTSYTQCSLPPGTYYFAVQARNAEGAMSAYSAERSVVIQTLAVLITRFEAALDDEGVRLSWRIEADEIVQGYRVYRREGTAPETRIADALDGGTSSFVDDEVRAGTSYSYVLAAIKADGGEVRSAPASVTTPALSLSLAQNYPNPFNPTTKIPFTLDTAGRVIVRVFDVRGTHVTTVFDGTLGEGRHSIDWNGRDDRGRPVASGLYLYTLTAGKRTLSRKMVLMK